MEYPMYVDVFCGTQNCGRSTNLVINPINEKVTHIVVAEKAFPNIERLVPVKYIIELSQTLIRLNCSKSEFAKMEPFVETDFISSGDIDTILPFEGHYQLWPYSLYEEKPMPLEYEHIPAGEVVIRRGTPVNATDGHVGKVDEFLVNPMDDGITHLILREGHLWGQKDVTIPVSEIDKITDEGVYLKLDKKAIAKLPAIPVNRKWK